MSVQDGCVQVERASNQLDLIITSSLARSRLSSHSLPYSLTSPPRSSSSPRARPSFVLLSKPPASALCWLAGARTTSPSARRLTSVLGLAPLERSSSPALHPHRWARSSSSAPVVKLVGHPSRLDSVCKPSSPMQGSHNTYSSHPEFKLPAAPSFVSTSRPSHLPPRPDNHDQRHFHSGNPNPLLDRLSRDTSLPGPSHTTGRSSFPSPSTTSSADPNVKGNRITSPSKRGYAHSVHFEDRDQG